jgi:hypothetical protein
MAVNKASVTNPSNPKIGTCKLCGTVGELRESHYMPKSAYKLIKRANKNAPVVLKKTVAIQKDEQIKDYVLCQSCEQRFSENGEKWVMQFCHRDGEGFKLKELIEASKPLLQDSHKLRVYSAANIAEIDIEKLAYFAASILWRGSAHKWKSGRDQLNGLDLGTKYEEELRRYLLGQTTFPRNAVLWVSVIPSAELSNTLLVPTGEKKGSCWRYKFTIQGITFTFFLGNRIDKGIRSFCAYRSPEKFIFSGDDVSKHVIEDATPLLKSAKPVGSLKKS